MNDTFRKIGDIIIIMILVISFGTTLYIYNKNKNICTNNASRNYKYEQYCDSIWLANPDYYLDTLTETDEYQLYIEAHGSWWSNSN